MPLLPADLSSERLLIRRYRRDDAGWYAAMARANHTHLERYESGNAAMTIAEAADALRVFAEFETLAAAGRAVFLGAFRRSDGVFVAQVYVGVADVRLPGYVIGFFTEAGALRRGYAGEAARAVVAALFRQCGAGRVGLWCDDTNIASQRIALGAGMRREGHVRADKRSADGSISGSLCFGILGEEFAAIQAGR